MNPSPPPLPPADPEAQMLNKNLAGLLSLAGVFLPGLQRFYMKHTRWGIGYVVVGLMVLPFFPVGLQVLSYGIRLICIFEGLWYLSMDNVDFHSRFNPEQIRLDWTSAKQRQSSDPEAQLEMMFREGVINESEYQQQRQMLRDRATKR